MALENKTRNTTGSNTDAQTRYYIIADYQKFHDVFFAIFTAVASFSFLLNIIVFTTYLCMKKILKSRKSNLLLCLQSCVDLIVSLSTSFYAYFISTFYDIAGYRAMEGPMYNVIDFTLKYSQLLAISSLFVFTCERFIAIIFPLFHRSQVTSKKILISLIFSSILSALPSSIFTYFSVTDFYNIAVPMFEDYSIATTSINLALILSVLILLGIAYRKIRQSLGGSRGKSNICTRTESNQRRDEDKQKRILTIFIVMCCIYTFTFLPLTIWNRLTPIIFSRQIIDFYLANIINFTFMLMYHLSALINPLITICFVKDYKDTFRSREYKNMLIGYSTNCLSLR